MGYLRKREAWLELAPEVQAADLAGTRRWPYEVRGAGSTASAVRASMTLIVIVVLVVLLLGGGGGYC
jgi:hypothetical protein